MFFVLLDLIDLSIGELIYGFWRREGILVVFVFLFVLIIGYNVINDVKLFRDIYKDYFVNEGVVEW